MADTERTEVVSTSGRKMSVPTSNLDFYLNNSWKVVNSEDELQVETADQLEAEEAAGDKIQSETVDDKAKVFHPNVDDRDSVIMPAE